MTPAILKTEHAAHLIERIRSSAWSRALCDATTDSALGIVKRYSDGRRRVAVVLARNIAHVYEEMCAECAVEPQHWNSIAKRLLASDAVLTKSYAWVIDTDGSRHRWRVYHIDVGGQAVAAPATPTASDVVKDAAALQVAA